MPNEDVLCVQTSLLRECGYFQGFMPLCTNYKPLFSSDNHMFQPRNVVETDPDLKQLIPYIIVERDGRVLNYYRSKGQGEARLRGKRSIGIGGHINPCDAVAAEMAPLTPNQADWMSDMYIRGMLRELTEELQFETTDAQLDIDLVGFINEDKTPVGQVHLGVVHVFHMPSGTVCTANEDAIQDLDWHTRPALCECLRPDNARGGDFELWSLTCLEHVNPIRPTPKKKFEG